MSATLFNWKKSVWFQPFPDHCFKNFVHGTVRNAQRNKSCDKRNAFQERKAA